ncbi:insulinase family protein [Actinoplanes friuliensis]|jgi:zinc protease|uniref:Peptidase M16 domain-containing protein n=1 Tax=Actinoplanes friuliensis DSM 7358 TaxID=1246995 RepID=U5W418_9ACTN|nr:insulinase family protein [Actinoplanes friuliensis]AGZ43879.1 peptidase M16 domain-containing protein [Actinoplanes friuliensis DSM 7358]
MIRHTEVDGVPTLIAPTSGPMTAGLMFRVGRADETLPRTGITHLLEHLVLHPLGQADYHYNGATAPVTTYFHMQGPEKDVAGFLSGVCDALNDLPLHRLETEKEILRTEGSSRSSHVTEPMALWRYGARDHGLVSYPEWGLNMITPDDLLAWSARYFTRDNAVLWIAGRDVPPGLTLRLPGGERRPVPAPSSALPRTPAYFAGDSRAVALEAVVRRRTAASVFAGVLERELFRGLRQEGGLSYTAGTDYNPRGDGNAVITALADALPEKQDAVLGGFIDILAKIRVGRIEQTDIDAVVAKTVDALDNAEVYASRLPSHAFSLLTGDRQVPVDELAGELRKVTVADVHEVALEAFGSALLMVPEGRSADWAGFTEAPTTSDRAVSGTVYPHLENGAVRLMVGPEGVSVAGIQDVVTVRYDQCACVLGWPDGRRMLIGTDAVTVAVEPTMFGGAAAALPFIDAALPAQLRVVMPARDPQSIPQPDPQRHHAAVAGPAGATGSRSWSIAGIVVLVLMFLLFGCLSGSLALGLLVEDKPDNDLWVIVGGGTLLAGYLGYAVVRNIQRFRRTT